MDGNLPSPIFGWVALICCVLLCVAVGFIRRGTLGQRMLAVRSNERAAAAAAINPRTVKLYAFTIAAFIAGVAGVLYAYNFGSVSADRFDAVTALSLIAFAYAGGITLISGAVFAGLLSAQALIPYALDKWFGLNGNWFLLVGGVSADLHPAAEPGGRGRRHLPADAQAGRGPRAGDRPPRFPRAAEQRRSEPISRSHPAVLRVTGLSVAFGGVHALRDVTLEVREGELVGLIGPNGAGKTTLVDAVSGFVRCSGQRGAGRGGHRRAAAPTSAPAAGWAAPGRARSCSTTWTCGRT